MTVKQIYEAILVELNKAEAPSLLLEDFVYFLNKTVNNFINKRYAAYDITQQTTDDLRVLKATAILPVSKMDSSITSSPLYKAVYQATLPEDYLHVINCVCEYNVKKTFKCYDKDSSQFFPARRLTGELWSQILNNFYMKPIYKRPYFYINNVNTSTSLPTNPNVTDKEFARIMSYDGSDVSVVEREGNIRYGNTSPAIVEIRYGRDDKVFELKNVHIDYIKTPQYIRITEDELEEVEDNTQILEFTDNVCYEIIRELTAILLENMSDPRLQSHIPINTSVVDPQPQQPQQKR